MCGAETPFSVRATAVGCQEPDVHLMETMRGFRSPCDRKGRTRGDMGPFSKEA